MCNVKLSRTQSFLMYADFYTMEHDQEQEEVGEGGGGRYKMV